jgi:hypothetical protein
MLPTILPVVPVGPVLGEPAALPFVVPGAGGAARTSPADVPAFGSVRIPVFG